MELCARRKDLRGGALSDNVDARWVSGESTEWFFEQIQRSEACPVRRF